MELDQPAQALPEFEATLRSRSGGSMQPTGLRARPSCQAIEKRRESAIPS